MRGKIVTGLDIGTYSIKALVAQKREKDYEVLSYAEIPSFGLRKGAVDDVEEVARNIKKIILEIEKDCNQKIKSVLVNIGGSHMHVVPSDGIISVSRADQRISEDDIERVLQAAKAINISSNEEIFDVFPKEYIIDDQGGIKQPEGLMGFKLEARVLLLCIFSRYFVNLTQAVLNSKLTIKDVIPSPLAAANAVLTPQQKELGVALIDMGAATTSLAVFEEGNLIHLAVFPVGAANITSDIAIGLKTEVAVAESIKKQYGTCMVYRENKDERKSRAAGEKKKIEVFDKSSSIIFTKKDLVNIIEPRVSEILELIQKELKRINKQELLPAGVVLTGGGANLPKIKELAKERLKLSCKIGKPEGIVGLQDNPSLATVAGLVLAGVDFEPEPGILGIVGLTVSTLKKIFRAFKP